VIGKRTPLDVPCPACGAGNAEILSKTVFREKDFYLARCIRCDQRFCVPPLTGAEIEELYQGDYQVALRKEGASERQFGAKFLRYRDWVLQFVKTGRSLDIGTSTGLFPSLLKQAGFAAEGLEFNLASAKWAEDHYGVPVKTCGLEESGAEKNSYDLISMTDVLEHTEHPLRFLQMTREYLKPGGVMLITFPDINSLESRYLRFFAWLFRRYWIWSCCYIPFHTWEFTPATARAMFEKADFDVCGYRRSQPKLERSSILPLALLRLPLHILRVPLLASLAGTQLEFVLRKRA
jgi:SAM-dependent methyltransferase